MHFIRVVFVLLLNVVFSSLTYAASFPHGCEERGFGYTEHNLIVNDTGDQAFYLIQNRGDKTIELQRIESKNVFMSPPLTAKLEASNWAAFASDVQNLNFECITTENETTTKIACRDVLEVCQYPRVKFALSNMGNYWVSTNKTQQQVINDAAAKGIYLRW